MPLNNDRTLSADELARWKSDGFLHLRGAIPAEETTLLRGAVDRLYALYLAGDLPNLSRDKESATIEPPHWGWIDPTWGRQAIGFRRWAIVEDDDVFLSILDHPGFFGAVVGIMGPHIQATMTHAIVLPPGMKDRPFIHVDGGDALERVLPREDGLPLLIKVQVFLTDVIGQNRGNFTVVPGSHRTTLPPEVAGKHPSTISGSRQLDVRAGDAIIFTHCLWHGVAPNQSDLPRKSLIYGYGQLCLRPYDYERASQAVLANCTPRQRRILGDLGGWYWRPGCYFYSQSDQAELMLEAAAH